MMSISPPAGQPTRGVAPSVQKAGQLPSRVSSAGPHFELAVEKLVQAAGRQAGRRVINHWRSAFQLRLPATN